LRPADPAGGSARFKNRRDDKIAHETNRFVGNLRRISNS